MNGDFISLTNDALWLVLILSAPPIIVASVAGLLVAIVVTASLIGASLYRYSDRIFSEFPAMIRR